MVVAAVERALVLMIAVIGGLHLGMLLIPIGCAPLRPWVSACGVAVPMLALLGVVLVSVVGATEGWLWPLLCGAAVAAIMLMPFRRQFTLFDSGAVGAVTGVVAAVVLVVWETTARPTWVGPIKHFVPAFVTGILVPLVLYVPVTRWRSRADA